MRNRILYTFTAMFLLTCFCLGQRGPAPALNTPFGNDVSMSYMLVAKDRNNPTFGNGAAINSTHYFTRQLGFTANAEALQMRRWTMREAAIRGGLTYRFKVDSNFQPFVRVLAGYSGVSASDYFVKGARPHKYGGSLLVGAGTDVRIKGPLFARITTDIVDDWDAKTRFVRGTAGFAFHFGDNGRQ